ncbi:HTTM domain-containing protein [Polycyclovorans algicola]|uniref:HTTM domain-containing protein n=1 Tax=Polycyclovorans algicola TaxID=616992 RepID=UPI0004A730A9|nr:HTTM domain-containing protein [Polycyclovorans algicola]
MGERLLRTLTAPRDIAALAVFRMLIGALMCVGALRFMRNGWIERLYVEPTFHFKYWGFGWVQVPGETGLYLLYAGIAFTAFMVAIGALYRVAIIAFWCLFTYAELMDVTTYLNHYYFISLLTLILCFLSPHRAWSVDAWLRPKLRAMTLPAWQTYWLRFQVGLLYFYAGWAKFEPDWLLHAQPLNIWLPPHSGLPLLGPLLEFSWVHYAFSWFAFMFDVTIIGFMLWRRTRLLAFAVILVFHWFTHLFFNIGLFPFIMVFAVLVFFDADWPRTLLARLRLPSPAPAAVANVGAAGAPRWSPLATTFALMVLVFSMIQFVLPLRQWWYPGTVIWHEQGMRFSWRVMLREKSGVLEYRVVTADGRTRLVFPRDYLTEQQYREMAGQPDLILQLAHHIRDDFDARGLGPVQVYADSQVSLNGRAAQRMIDPAVDLAHVEDGLARAEWILPAPEGPPPLHRPLRLAVTP